MASLQKAQHVQRPGGRRDRREQEPRGWALGPRRGCSPARALGPGLAPQPAAPQPARLRGASLSPPARWSRGRPGASNGLPGPRSGERSPAALMCGRPARRQLVPPRRPRAPIDTHQAAGGWERPLPGRL